MARGTEPHIGGAPQGITCEQYTVRVTRNNSSAPEDLQQRADRVFTAVDELCRKPFTGEITISVVAGRATELVSEREHNGPIKV